MQDIDTNLSQLLVALSDFFHFVLSFLSNFLIYCLGLVVITSQEELVGLGHILKELMLTSLLVIKDICSCLCKTAKLVTLLL